MRPYQINSLLHWRTLPDGAFKIGLGGRNEILPKPLSSAMAPSRLWRKRAFKNSACWRAR